MILLKKLIFILFLLLFGTAIFSQDKIVDSLNHALKNAKHDTTKLRLLVKLSEECEPTDILKYAKPAVKLADKLLIQEKFISIKNKLFDQKAKALGNIAFINNNQGDYTEALENYERCLKIYKNLKDKKSVANSLNGIGQTLYNLSDFPSSLDYYNKSLNIRQEIGDKEGMAFSINNIAAIYEYQGNISKALDFYGKSLKLMEGLGEKQGTASLLNNIAGIYSGQGDITNAFEYYNRSLKIYETIGNKNGIATSLNNIGFMYKNQGNIPKALEYYEKSLKIQKEIDDKSGMAYSLNNIGKIYKKQGNLPKALEYLNKSLKKRKENGDKKGVAYSLNNIGALYIKIAESSATSGSKKKNYLFALSYSDSSLAISKELGFPENIRNAEGTLSKIDSARGNYLGAFEHYKQYIIFRDSLNNKETHKASMKNQIKYEYDKKSVADSVRVQEEKKVISAKLNEEKTKSYALYGGLVLVLVFAGFMVNRFRVTNKQKQIIELKEHETQKQNEVISHQKYLVEEKHKEITDSINYAERIQRSFLASKELLNENLNEHFVFFQPKDIVSGDFYWASKLRNGNFILATADSTGHGVPGAIMSILNISCLENAVKDGILEPSAILNHTRINIIERLKKDGSEQGGKDGMDCSLVCFDFKNKTLTYSAANNPVWIVRENKIMEFAPDKMPVGKHDKDNISFTQREFKLQEGDIVYTLTDGMPDQFGGPKGKKFMYKHLKEFLISISDLTLEIQKEKLQEAISNWKGDLEQVDDVLIIGIKI